MTKMDAMLKLLSVLLFVWGVAAVITLREPSTRELAELPPEILEDPLYQMLIPPPPVTRMYKMGWCALITGAIMLPFTFQDELRKVRRVLLPYLKLELRSGGEDGKGEKEVL